jgi:abortive infection bacteriophage resistance protein
MKYTKPALPIEAQIAQLEERGMAFADRAAAARYLREINYYRLRGYWLRREVDRAKHQFHPETTFDDVLADYVFDRELRLLVMDAIERVEVSVRTRWAHELGLRHGSHAHLDSTLFKARSQHWNHPDAVAGLIRAVEQSREIFIQHLRSTYDELLPPIWAVVEVMSLGQISRWLDNLRHAADRNAIAEGYDLDESLLASALHHLTVVRNICAHHGRLWDRSIAIKSQLPRKNPSALVASLSHDDAGHTYNTLTILGWLLDRISPGQTWIGRLARRVDCHPPAREILGFPADYRSRPVWHR